MNIYVQGVTSPSLDVHLGVARTLSAEVDPAAGIEPGAGQGGNKMQLLKLTRRYADERRARGEINDKTASSIKRVLFRFAEAVEHREARKLTRRHVERWLEGMTNVRPGTRYHEFSVVRCFTKWCVLNGHMRSDPTVGIKAPKVPKAAPRKLTSTDAQKVVAYAPDARARVIVLLQLQELLRRAEVAAIEFGDIDLITRELAVRGKGGAGGVTRHVSVSEETAWAIAVYLHEHPAGAGPLLRSYLRPAEGLTAHYVGQMVARWMAEAGVKERPWDGKSGHALRHTGASNMVENGADLLETSVALGHENYNTTKIYTRGVTPNLRKAMGGRQYLTT